MSVVKNRLNKFKKIFLESRNKMGGEGETQIQNNRTFTVKSYSVRKKNNITYFSSSPILESQHAHAHIHGFVAISVYWTRFNSHGGTFHAVFTEHYSIFKAVWNPRKDVNSRLFIRTL